MTDRDFDPPWPKLFHNLRATRQTELTYEHPQHVVCRWLGNSPLIAQRHYLQVTDEDFARAAGIDQTATETGKNDRRKVTHKATQHVRARGRRESQADLPAQKKTPVLPGSAASCDSLPQGKVEDRGLEPGPSSSGKTPLSQQGNTESNAFSGDDERLLLLIERWPTLSKTIQQQIMLLVG